MALAADTIESGQAELFIERMPKFEYEGWEADRATLAAARGVTPSSCEPNAHFLTFTNGVRVKSSRWSS